MSAPTPTRLSHLSLVIVRLPPINISPAYIIQSLSLDSVVVMVFCWAWSKRTHTQPPTINDYFIYSLSESCGAGRENVDTIRIVYFVYSLLLYIFPAPISLLSIIVVFFRCCLFRFGSSPVGGVGKRSVLGWIFRVARREMPRGINPKAAVAVRAVAHLDALSRRD
jgi:hypothetical protein